VPYSDVGVSGLLKHVAVFDLCQDLASRHAYQLGISAIHVGEKGKIWVVHRYHFDFKRLPFWDEEIRVESYRSPFKRLYEMRSFDFFDENNENIIHGICAWVLVDKESGKPLRLDRVLPDNAMISNRKIEFDFKDIPPVRNLRKTHKFEVLKDDIDFNNHANNASYIKWGLEVLPYSDNAQPIISSLDIRFHKDTGVGTNIIVESFPEKRERGVDYLQSIKSEKGDILASLFISENF